MPPATGAADVFVSRQSELAKLNSLLDRALEGQGRVAFVCGEAGSGKTVLLKEFARQAMERHESAVVALGACDAHSGVGDPYLPFRDDLPTAVG